MIFPTVHLNGTHALELLEQHVEAIRALREAQSKLALACPNGRDYYPQGPDAIKTAMREHTARMSKLIEIIRELEAIAENLN
jgi:hypothetical protein